MSAPKENKELVFPSTSPSIWQIFSILVIGEGISARFENEKNKSARYTAKTSPQHLILVGFTLFLKPFWNQQIYNLLLGICYTSSIYMVSMLEVHRHSYYIYSMAGILRWMNVVVVYIFYISFTYIWITKMKCIICRFSFCVCLQNTQTMHTFTHHADNET